MQSDPEDEIAAGTAITEDEAAIAFAKKYSGQLAFCHSQKKWLQFDGSIWREQKTNLAYHFVRLLARRLSAKSTSPAQLRKTRFVDAIERFAKSDPLLARTAEYWDPDLFLLGTPDGTVDLRTGVLRPSRPTDNITRGTVCPPADIANCPTWLKFLNETTNNDAELIRFLKQMAGYALTGSTQEHALFFVYGPGGNGKGVFLNTIQAVMADYATVAAMETFQAGRGNSHPTDLAMLRGARLVTASETDEGGAWAEARIKQMTGGDPISARFMKQDFFTYNPQFTLIIVGNHKPALRSVDDAMRRRFNIIPFTNSPPAPDETLQERLKDEYPSILRWMIDGCLDWQEHGLQRPSVVREATEEYFEDQNTMDQWLELACDVDRSNHHLFEKSSALYNSWSGFAKQNGIDAGSSKTFKPSMEKLNFKFKKDMLGRWFHGVALKKKTEEREVSN